MNLSPTEARAIADLLHISPIFPTGDRLAVRYKVHFHMTTEEAEAHALETVKTLIKLSGDLKEFLE